MLELINNDLNFYAPYLVGGLKGTGLTITCTVYRGSNGAVLVSGQSATEIGNTGIYRYTLASSYVTAEDEYIGLFNEAAETADQVDVASIWAVNKAGLEILGSLGAGSVTITSPVADDGTTLELIRGDDYMGAHNRSISFTSSDWPDLTGATRIILTIRRNPDSFSTGGSSDSVMMSRKDESAQRVTGAGSQTIVFQLDNESPGTGEEGDTDALLPASSAGKYDVEATLSDGAIVTLVLGVVNVTEDQTRA